MIEYFTRRNKKRNIDNWEEVPDEDLWQDGELKLDEVFDNINWHVFHKGDWILIRRKDD